MDLSGRNAQSHTMSTQSREKFNRHWYNVRSGKSASEIDRLDEKFTDANNEVVKELNQQRVTNAALQRENVRQINGVKRDVERVDGRVDLAFHCISTANGRMDLIEKDRFEKNKAFKEKLDLFENKIKEEAQARQTSERELKKEMETTMDAKVATAVKTLKESVSDELKQQKTDNDTFKTEVNTEITKFKEDTDKKLSDLSEKLDEQRIEDK